MKALEHIEKAGAGSLWHFKEPGQRVIGFVIHKKITGTDNELTLMDSNLTLMYLGCNDVYSNEITSNSPDGDIRFYKMMVVDENGCCSIGWISHYEAADLSRVEE